MKSWKLIKNFALAAVYVHWWNVGASFNYLCCNICEFYALRKLFNMCFICSFANYEVEQMWVFLGEKDVALYEILLSGQHVMHIIIISNVKKYFV